MTRSFAVVRAAFILGGLLLVQSTADAQTKLATQPTTAPTTRPFASVQEIDGYFGDQLSRTEKAYQDQLDALRKQRIQELTNLQDRALADKNVDLVVQLREVLSEAKEDAGDAVNPGPAKPSAAGKPDPVKRGASIGDAMLWAADDFVVTVWQNGKVIDPSQRKLENEVFGATVERLTADVHEGDWLVFQLANNRKRWKGSRLFMGTVMNSGIAVLETKAGPPWYVCDDPSKVQAFIANADSGNERPIKRIPLDEAWHDGMNRYKKKFPEGKAEPIWGDERVTWIKLRVPPSGAGPAKIPGPAKPAEPKGKGGSVFD